MAEGEQESSQQELVVKKESALRIQIFCGLNKEETDSDKAICWLCQKSVLAMVATLQTW